MTRQDLIHDMKKTSFGCEIEMAGISRKKAARIAARELQSERLQYTADRNGKDTWSTWDSQGREWMFSKDTSIAGSSDNVCEMITPVLHYEQDLEVLQRLVRALRHAGARSNASLKCGVHIHVSGEGHTVRTLINLVHLMAAHEQQLIKAVNIQDERLNRYCKTVNPDFLERLHRMQPKTMEELKACWYDGNPDLHHYSHTRYYMLNLHSFFTRYHTIEFRLFQFDERSDRRRGGLHAGQLRAMILLCLALNQEAKRRKYISPKPQQTENEAFAFRTFLVRLGFVGEEFREPRKYFLRNAAGNSAWRFGHDGR